MKARFIESLCVVDEEGCALNVKSALARGLPVCGLMPERTGSLAIVGSGPSVRDYLDELRSWPGTIWAINGAYDFLIGHGIVPQGFVGVDPLPGLAEYVKGARAETTFYLASICDPAAFDALDGHSIDLWHSARDNIKVPVGQMIVCGGTTAITRAPFLAHMLGWRSMTIFGADSSFDTQRYCYGDGKYRCDSVAPVNWVKVGDEGPFPTELCLIKQVSQFGVIAQRFGDMLQFKCGGLLAAYLRSPMMDDSEIEVENADAA